jgi:RNA polymerase sigma factor (sigma-70 family)
MDCDELLIDLMCENNEEAHTIFRKRYMSFVRMWVMGYKNIMEYLRLDEDELVNEIYMHVYESLSTYNYMNGYFYSYARRCATNYIFAYLKKMSSESRKIIYECLSIDAYLDDVHTYEDMVRCEYGIAKFDKQYDARENLDGMLSVMDEFDADEKKIAYLRYMGEKPKSIADTLQLNERQVEYKTSTIKKKLTSCIKT